MLRNDYETEGWFERAALAALACSNINTALNTLDNLPEREFQIPLDLELEEASLFHAQPVALSQRPSPRQAPLAL